jgi:hypothetical protein
MEPIIGFCIAFVLAIVIPIYLRFFAAEGARNRQFERWCRTRPIVAAFLCAPEDTVDVYERVRHEIEPKGDFFNSAGRFPWQHYVITVDCRRLGAEVIVFHLTGCRSMKIHDTKPDLTKSIDALGAAVGSRIQEVWLHGQLHAIRRTLGVDRESASWLGDFDDEGRLAVTGMIGHPPWLAEATK